MEDGLNLPGTKSYAAAWIDPGGDLFIYGGYRVRIDGIRGGMSDLSWKTKGAMCGLILKMG